MFRIWHDPGGGLNGATTSNVNHTDAITATDHGDTADPEVIAVA